jgi:hypothetical protein
MKRLALTGVLALVLAAGASAHASYAYNTGYSCAGYPTGYSVPIEPYTFYVCYGGKWWVSHVSH